MKSSIVNFAESCGVLYTLFNSGEIDLNQFQIAFNKEYQQAIEMHKQEIIDAYATVITKYNGVKSWTKIHDEEGEQYYNETYLNNQLETDK